MTAVEPNIHLLLFLLVRRRTEFVWSLLTRSCSNFMKRYFVEMLGDNSS